MNQRKKALVTGGAGFIGSHVVEDLLGRDYQVIVIDDLSTGNKENLEPLIKNNSIDFIKGSITDLPLLQKYFSGVNCVFHLGAIASVTKSLENPQLVHEVNITGTLNVLIAAKENNVGKVIYTSSCAVYGNTSIQTINEETSPSLLSPYAASKLAGEYYCQAFTHSYGLPTICLRYFNVYGPRQEPDSQYAAVIPIFIKNLCNRKPITIFGDGNQTRDFVFVKDVAAANMIFAANDVIGTFNVGSGESTTINALVRLLSDVAGKEIECIYQKPRVGDIKHSRADISRLINLGYRTKYNLKEGIRYTAEKYFDIHN